MSDGDDWKRQDRPISSKKEDHLDRGPFVESLRRALVRDVHDDEGHLIGRKATGYVVGLTGKWGLGKSSVLALLEERLRIMPYVLVTTFNPWLFKGRDELLAGFFAALQHAMRRSAMEEAHQLADQLNKYWKIIDVAGHALAAYADAHGAGGQATAAWSQAKKLKPARRAPPSLQKQKAILESKLRKSKLAVVVLIDELDRVEDDEVRAVAQLVKAIGDIRGISYLVAYDPERVAEALGRGEGDARRESGERYIEKIIQYPIPLRPLFEDDINALLTAALDVHRAELPKTNAEYQERILHAIKAGIVSPRDVKRLIGAFAIIEAAVRGEVCPYDTLAYCWILTKSPSLRNAIAANADKIVDDPSEAEMAARVVARMGSTPKTPLPADILGEPAVAHDALLRLLFGRFGAPSETSEDHGMRIARRRNLTRLLYLGNPPSMISRADVERIWRITNQSDLDHELDLLVQKGTIFSLLDRLDDLLPDLHESGDISFWPAVARLTVRRSDWISAPESLRNLAEDAGAALLRLGTRDPKNASRVKRALEALISSGDLVIAPWILRKQMFAHGLTKHSKQQSSRYVLGSKETMELLERETPRYRAAVLDGTALKRLPNMEAVYVLGNVNRWDHDLRTAWTDQLMTPEAIATIAALVVPPGYSTEQKHLNELFDTEAVAKRVDNLGPTPLWVTDPWVAESVKRFRTILRGGDPFFLDEEDES